MFRPIIGFAALGIGAFVAIKLLALVIPAVLMIVGIALLGLKILLIGLLAWALIRIFKRITTPRPQAL